MYLFKEKRSPFYHIIFYDDEGIRRKKTTKKKTKSEALKFLADFKNHLKEKNKFHYIRLSKFETEYQEYISKSKSKHYKKSIKLSFSQLVKYLSNPILNEITHKQVEKFIYDTFQRTQSGAGLYYRTLKAAFNVALRWGYIKENPFLSVKVPKQKRSLPIFMSITELERILECTKEKYLQDLFYTAFYTGMRLAEICNLQWDAVSLNENYIKVSNTETFTTKSKLERIVPINSTLRKILLKKYPKVMSIAGREYVFYRIKGVKLNEDFVSKKFKAAVRAAKLNDRIRFHDLRHAFASNLVAKGVSLIIVKELLGHSSISTTMIYSHVQRDNLFEAVQKLADTNYSQRAMEIY